MDGDVGKEGAKLIAESLDKVAQSIAILAEAVRKNQCQHEWKLVQDSNYGFGHGTSRAICSKCGNPPPLGGISAG